MPLIRFQALRGAIASFAVDLFQGRVGAVTDAPIGERWGWWDGTAWRYAAYSDNAGNVDSASLATSGAVRVDFDGNGSFKVLACAEKLQTNGATDPGWGVGWSVNILGPAFAIATEIATGNVSVACNLYHDGTDWRLIVDEADVVPRLTGHNVNGYVYIFSDNATVHLAGEVWSAVLDYSLAPGGDLSAKSFTGTGFTEGALLRSVSGKITSVASIVREAIIQPLPITNSAPGVVTVVSGGVKSFGFDGGASTEELFYHLDTQHDYIAGTDMVFHIHWVPATGAGGNVKWQIEYQWVEGGAVWPAPTAASVVTAAGTTAWADLRSDLTISGTGRTYNSRLLIRLFRNPVDAADTYAGDAVLTSVGLHYSANPGQP